MGLDDRKIKLRPDDFERVMKKIAEECKGSYYYTNLIIEAKTLKQTDVKYKFTCDRAYVSPKRLPAPEDI